MFRRTAAFLLPVAAVSAPASAQPTPQAAVEALLAAEREFSRRAASRRPIEGIEAMFAQDVVVPTRQGLVSGRDAVRAAWRASGNYAGRHAQWRPIRGGISADGRHGFTFGYLEIAGAERPRRRYLAYWVKRPEGWRVVAYRQGFQESEPPIGPLPPSLPARMATASSAPPAAHARSLSAAEQAFSDRAQQVGLRAAFTEFGRPDAMNMGQSNFRIGNEAIGQSFREASTSPVAWSADRVIVASSGDLGVTIGTIRPNGPVPEGQPASVPFFTIWRRDDPGQPWRYIAE